MSKLDMIIGYSAIKGELRQIADILKNRDAYDKLGVSAPRGLLLHSEPGLSKFLMASAIIEESGRQTFVCRKDLKNKYDIDICDDTQSDASDEDPQATKLYVAEQLSMFDILSLISQEPPRWAA